MHSYIYQIGVKPFTETSPLSPDTIEGEDRNQISYAYEISEEERAINIRILVETVLPAGMFVVNEENNLVYKGGFKIWRKAYFDKVMKCAQALTPANIMDEGGHVLDLLRAINNPLETLRLFECGNGIAEQSMALLHLIEGLEKGDILYVGSVLGYHN